MNDVALPVLPQGWTATKIGDVVELVDEPIAMSDDELYHLVSIRRGYGGLFRRESLRGREILTKTLRRVIPDTIVLARMQIVHGAVAYASRDFAGTAISKSYSSFRGRPSCDTRYLWWLFRHPLLKRYYLDASQGVVIEKMTFDQDRWLTFEVPVPPLGEQVQIRQALDTTQDAIDTSADVLAKLRMLKHGMSDELLRLPGIPRRRLADVSTVSNGSTPSRQRADYWLDGTVPWLASGKVNDYRIDSPSELITEKAVSETSLRILPSGSVVLGMIGQGRTRGMSAILKIDACINQNLAGVVPGPMLNSSFLHHALVHRYDDLRSASRGSNQDALNTRIVASFRIPVPEIGEQEKIARALDGADMQIRVETERTEKLRALREALADDLLMGRVRVPMEATV